MVQDWLGHLTNFKPVENELPEWKPKNAECVQLFERARRGRLEDLERKGQRISSKDWENPGPRFWDNPIIPFHDAPETV